MSAIKKQWIVLTHQARGSGPGIEWFNSKDAANVCATQMAARHPGKRFVVLEVVGTAMVPLPALTIEEVN